jgi:hypothetical protein
MTASVPRAGQIEIIAEHGEQAEARQNLDVMITLVDRETDEHRS